MPLDLSSLTQQIRAMGRATPSSRAVERPGVEAAVRALSQAAGDVDRLRAQIRAAFSAGRGLRIAKPLFEPIHAVFGQTALPHQATLMQSLIARNGKPEWAVLPCVDTLRVVKQAEMLEAIQDYDRAKAGLDACQEEIIPAAAGRCGRNQRAVSFAN